MAARMGLQALLLDICDNVYFQPPESLTIDYPCIIYNRNNIDTDFANNVPYRHETGYLITVIDRDPDSDIPGKVAALPKCVFDRFATADNLNHDYYKIFF